MLIVLSDTRVSAQEFIKQQVYNLLCTKGVVTMMTIAFIGLGNMGNPMALNLIKAGYPLKVFDVVPEAMETAMQAGAKVAKTTIEAVTDADIVISMLPASAHVEELYLNEECRLLSAIDPAAVVIDCSTIAPDSAMKVHQAAQKQGLDMLDAPVSGGVTGAVAGTLTFIVGGDKPVFERCQEVFAAMGKNCFHAGGASAGQVAKICNNMLLAVTMAGTAEALQLGVANGLDPVVLSAIMQQSSGNNWSLSNYNPWPGVMPEVPAAKDYQGGFLVDLMLKDLALAMSSSTAENSPVPMGQQAYTLYQLLKSNQAAGRKDFSSIQNLYSRKP